MKPIHFRHTHIAESAKNGLATVLDSRFISEGKVNKSFEKELADFLGHPYLFTLNSGTSALHLALLLAGIGPGDEVILPAQTFIATGLAITYTGAKAVFVDIDFETGNLDPNSIEAAINPATKAIMVVHWGGHSADLDRINTIAQSHNLKVIEDAAHAFGALYNGTKIGSHSDLVCFSFQAIKHISTGDGGAICCNNPKDLSKGKRLRWFGIDREKDVSNELGERQYLLSETGFKYHLNDLSAALGIENLKGFEQRLERRRNIARKYNETLQKVAGIESLKNLVAEDAFWLYGCTVTDRMDFIRKMNSHQIPVSVVHQGIDKHPLFGEQKYALRNQRKFDETQIHLPIHEALDDEQVDYVCEKITEGW